MPHFPVPTDDPDWLRRSERLLGDSDLLAAIVAAQREIATAELDLGQVHDLVCIRAQQLTRAEGAAVGVIDDGVLVFHAACGMLMSLMEVRFALSTTLVKMESDGATCDLAVAAVEKEVCKRVGARAAMQIPLLDADKIIGILLVASPRAQAFDDRVCHTLELLSSFVASALSHAAAFQQLAEEKKRTEDALQLSERVAEVGRQAASIAHEIKNPLESMANLVYLLEQHPTLDKAARTYVQWLEQELSRAVEISHQTLEFSKESSDRATVSISGVLDKVLDFYAHKIRFKKIVVDKRYDAITKVNAFPGEIRQVFSNLLVNAMEAVAIGSGKLTLHTFNSSLWPSRAAGVRVVIADNGSGIHPEHRARVFEPFFTTKAKGTGLGLWVTKRLVYKHGGSIRFRSRFHPEHGGTCFAVFFPAVR